MDDLKWSPIKYNKKCNYLHNLDSDNNDQIKENIKVLLSYCAKLRPFHGILEMQIKAHNKTTHHVLKNEVDIILPRFPGGQKSKRGILVQLFQALLAYHSKKFWALYVIEDTKPYIKQLRLCQFKHTYKETNLCI